jgi:hypothetical protein
MAPWLRHHWGKHGNTLLLIAVAFAAMTALSRSSNTFPQLIWESDGFGAFDLTLRHREVQRWFAGLSVYDPVEKGDYPPTSYAILWPLLGWLSLGGVKWLWAVTTVVTLGTLAYVTVRESRASTLLQGAFVALLALPTYAAQMTISLGQLGNHVVPALLAGIVWLHRGRGRFWEDLGASTLLVFALVKLTIAVPFFWIVCFLPGRLRPIVLVSLGYVALTLFSISFQQGDFFTLLLGWLEERPHVLQGHANVHRWLAEAGLRVLMLPSSCLILAMLGLWTFQNRRRDLWILLGVAALVARLWMHHRPYDDVLLLVPMIALFRLAKTDPSRDGNDVTAGLLLAVTWISTLVPTRVFAFPSPFPMLIEAGQSLLWLAVLLFLLHQVRREREGRACAPSRAGLAT